MTHQLLIVSASQRSASQSKRIATFLRDTWTTDKLGSAKLWCLAEEPLPFWDEDLWNPNSQMTKDWQPFSEKMKEADAFVFVSPEWAGIVPPALKNLLLFCSGGQLAHKPAMIVGVSSSRGGAYPISELRMSGYKNSYVCYIPDQLIFRDVEGFLVDPAQPKQEDNYMIDRSVYSLRVLAQYAKALALVRSSGVIDLKTYPFGM